LSRIPLISEEVVTLVILMTIFLMAIGNVLQKKVIHKHEDGITNIVAENRDETGISDVSL
jgi:hypothetical protein